MPISVWAAWRFADSKERPSGDFIEALAAFFAEYDPRGVGEQPSIAFLAHGAKVFAAASRGSADKALGLARGRPGPRPIDLYKVAAIVRAIGEAKLEGNKLTLKQAMRNLHYRGSASTLRSTMTRKRARITEINAPYEVSLAVEVMAKSQAEERRRNLLGDQNPDRRPMRGLTTMP